MFFRFPHMLQLRENGGENQVFFKNRDRGI